MTSTDIRITPHHFSPLFWQQVFCPLALDYAEHFEVLQRYFHTAEELRQHAEYNTGSINISGSLCLFALARYFCPTTIAEVGTFIGNSTHALAYGVSHLSHAVTLATCDYSNAIKINLPFSNVTIKQFPKQSSTDLLRDLIEQQQKVDMLFLDGRLSDEDVELLPDVLAPNALLVFDDFEGIEKGVVNALKCRQHQHFNNHILVTPPSDDDFAVLPVGMRLQRHNTAALFPAARIRFCPQ